MERLNKQLEFSYAQRKADILDGSDQKERLDISHVFDPTPVEGKQPAPNGSAEYGAFWQALAPVSAC